MDNTDQIRKIVSNYFRCSERNGSTPQFEDVFTMLAALYCHNRTPHLQNGYVRPVSNTSSHVNSSSQERPSTSKPKSFVSKRNVCNGASTSRGVRLNIVESVKSIKPMKLQAQDTPCHACNGYYGSRNDDPYCSICHAFLYPNMTASEEITSRLGQSSDSDSGNDEPVDNSFSRRPQLMRYFIHLPEVNPMLRRSQGELSNYVPVRVNSLAEELQKFSTPDSHNPSPVGIEVLPPEVLMYMIQYLDEISLWSIGQVCVRWKEILLMCVKQDQWKKIFKIRWSLYPSAAYDQITDWYEAYTTLMKSSCCIKCIRQMAAQALPPNWEENQWRKHRLRSELRALRNDPLDGIEAVPLDASYCHWQATIHGPTGSPYEGGLFFLYIQVPASYPLYPPVVRFLTKVFHPNISRHGDVGIDSIRHNWSLIFTLSKLLISIQSLLTDPYCDVCMEPEIARLYLINREEFNRQAQVWTFTYAMHDMRVI